MKKVKIYELIGQTGKQKIIDDYLARLKNNICDSNCQLKNNSHGVNYFSNDMITGSNVVITTNNNNSNNMIASWNDAGISVTC